MQTLQNVSTPSGQKSIPGPSCYEVSVLTFVPYRVVDVTKHGSALRDGKYKTKVLQLSLLFQELLFVLL